MCHNCLLPPLSPDFLSTNDQKTLVNELQEVVDIWFSLGVQLNMSAADLNSIRADFRDKSSDCLQEMLLLWLSRNDPFPPSWQRVVDALCSRSIDRPALAERIRRTYCSKSLGMTTLFEDKIQAKIFNVCL